MNIFKWFLRRRDTEEIGGRAVAVEEFLNSDVDAVSGLAIYLQRMAFWQCVRKIGAAVAAVEWETYRRGKSVRAREYWAWNYAPNPNETREQFFQKLIAQLFSEQEALVIETPDGARYVADAFSVEKRLSGDIYRDIAVDAESVPGTFAAEDVLHFTLPGERIKRILIAIASAKGQLIQSAASNYIRDQGMKGVLKIDDTAEADPDFEETYEDLINNKFKKYFTAENAVLPVFNGYEFTERTASGGSSKSNLIGTRDIRNLIDDILELTAQAIGIPPSIAAGKGVTDADFKELMTLLIQPLVRMIAEEINRKLCGRDLVFAGTYFVPNYAGVRYTELFDVANPIDKLIGSGAFCINDIRVRLGLGVIDEPWAWQHWMTKNYSSVEDLLAGVDSNTAPAAEPPENKEESDEETDGEPSE